MIGRLQGLLLVKDDNEILLDVQGVGYEVEVPASTLVLLPEIGSGVILYTHFVVREDAQHLYGFIDQRERSLFRLLIKVNGVGPKLALGVLSHMESGKFVSCVMNDDINALVKLPGVGRKTAERLIIEMRDRLKVWELEYGKPAVTTTPQAMRADSLQEAESALISLGYKPLEASRAIVHAANSLGTDSQPQSTEQLIRLALRNLARASAS
ncbi:MAG: Holliday junction branch migration protein RuvA [Pseudomonadota bacterium]